MVSDPSQGGKGCLATKQVLILLLMEYGLGQLCQCHKWCIGSKVLILLLMEHITNFRISEQPWWHHVSERRHKVTKYAATVQLLPPKKRQMPATL